MLLEASCRRITPLRNTLSSPLWTPPNWFDENMFHSSSKAAHCQSQSHSLQKLPDAQLLRRLLIASCCHIRTITPYNNKGCKRDVCSSTNYERAHQHAIANHGLAHSRLLQQPIVSKDDCGKRFGRKNGFSNITYAGLHLILGPMFAGKTTALLQRIQAEADAGRNVALVKSDKDTRYGLNAVVSHDGIQMSCMAVPDLATFKEKLGKFYYEVEVIGIDEAQFFKDLIEFCKAAADNDGKTVIVAGLDGDFLRRKFGSAVDLIPLADSVTKLSSRCELCGQPAPFTFRKTEDLEKEVIGGADVYMPVCRRHYISEQVALNSSMVDNELHTVVS